MKEPHIDILEVSKRASPVSADDLAKLGPRWRECLRVNRCLVDDKIHMEMTALEEQVGICMPETNWLSAVRLQRYEKVGDTRVRDQLIELFNVQKDRALRTADLMVAEAEFEQAYWQAEVVRPPPLKAWIWSVLLTALGTYWFRIPGAIIGGFIGFSVGQWIASSRRTNAINEWQCAVNGVARAKETAMLRKLNAEMVSGPASAMIQ